MAHELDHRLVLRAVDLDRRARMRLGALEQLLRLGMQSAGFEHEHRDVERQRVDQMRDHHILGAQARGLLDRLELGRGATQQRLPGRELVGIVGRGLGVQLGGRQALRLEGGRAAQCGGFAHVVFLQAVLAKRGCREVASPW